MLFHQILQSFDISFFLGFWIIIWQKAEIIRSIFLDLLLLSVELENAINLLILFDENTFLHHFSRE